MLSRTLRNTPSNTLPAIYLLASNNFFSHAQVFRKASLFRELRKEAIYTSLVHPSIIALRGICIAPLCLLLGT